MTTAYSIIQMYLNVPNYFLMVRYLYGFQFFTVIRNTVMNILEATLLVYSHMYPKKKIELNLFFLAL